MKMNLDEEVIATSGRKNKKIVIIALLACLGCWLILILITVIKVKQDADNNLNSYGQGRKNIQTISMTLYDSSLRSE